MSGKRIIIWTNQAKKFLKSIYVYFKEKSIQGAKHVKNDLLRGPRTIEFAKQYQVDDINPKYRRIVVRDFKLLYKEDMNNIEIVDIISTKRSPARLKKL